MNNANNLPKIKYDLLAQTDANKSYALTIKLLYCHTGMTI